MFSYDMLMWIIINRFKSTNKLLKVAVFTSIIGYLYSEFIGIVIPWH